MNIEATIRAKIEQELQPEHLEVLNESSNHNVPPNSETHFKVTVVSEAFANHRQVQRHQWVYKLLAEELQGPVHALALHTFTPGEWRQDARSRTSPPCLGGEK